MLLIFFIFPTACKARIHLVCSPASIHEISCWHHPASWSQDARLVWRAFVVSEITFHQSRGQRASVASRMCLCKSGFTILHFQPIHVSDSLLKQKYTFWKLQLLITNWISVEQSDRGLWAIEGFFFFFFPFCCGALVANPGRNPGQAVKVQLTGLPGNSQEAT